MSVRTQNTGVSFAIVRNGGCDGCGSPSLSMSHKSLGFKRRERRVNPNRENRVEERAARIQERETGDGISIRSVCSCVCVCVCVSVLCLSVCPPLPQ